MKTLRAELHVHTLLSPCAEVEMIPPFIVQEALDQGIQLIAITDHNAIANIAAVQKAASGTELIVLPGIELQTREEVHSLCIFDTLEQVQAFHQFILPKLPPIENQPEHFGEQFIVDETGDFIRREPQLLLTSADLSLTEAWQQVQTLGGLMIPAHVDRKAFGLLAMLGLVPTDIPIVALEISRHLKKESAFVTYPQLKGFPLIQSGDVHRLEEFMGVNQFVIMQPTVQELILALRGQQERRHKILTLAF